MARPRKSEGHSLSPGQASYVLDRLVGDRRVSRADINRYVDDMKREISVLEQRLQSLNEATGDAISRAIHAVMPGRRRGRPPGSASSSSTGGAKRARAKITPEQLASRKLQGRYLGLIRQIPASRRAQYQKIAKERGREAAIKEMAATLNK